MLVIKYILILASNSLIQTRSSIVLNFLGQCLKQLSPGIFIQIIKLFFFRILINVLNYLFHGLIDSLIDLCLEHSGVLLLSLRNLGFNGSSVLLHQIGLRSAHTLQKLGVRRSAIGQFVIVGIQAAHAIGEVRLDPASEDVLHLLHLLSDLSLRHGKHVRHLAHLRFQRFDAVREHPASLLLQLFHVIGKATVQIPPPHIQSGVGIQRLHLYQGRDSP
mmetsp:Transcript_22906/g.34132  ORF Transcript_22906/g.34132 Transcript_22906/m.34132 type:complete len:218 (-) Transcript_22906:247-900(-)